MDEDAPAEDEFLEDWFYPSDSASNLSFGEYCEILGQEYADTY
jgi:hypothetical protein